MKKYFLLYIVALIGLTFSLSSCHTSAPRLNYKALAKASVRMGVDINMEDNHKLYIASAEWMGVRYRAGGDNKHGVDCSGVSPVHFVQIQFSINLKKYIISVWPEAPMVCLKKATKSPAAICVREIWCFSPAVHPRRKWHTWVSTSKTGSLFMQVPAKELLSVASTNNTIHNTGFAAAE